MHFKFKEPRRYVFHISRLLRVRIKWNHGQDERAKKRLRCSVILWRSRLILIWPFIETKWAAAFPTYVAYFNLHRRERERESRKALTWATWRIFQNWVSVCKLGHFSAIFLFLFPCNINVLYYMTWWVTECYCHIPVWDE